MDPAFLDRLALSYGLYAVPAESGERGAAVFSQGAESDPRRRADEKIFFAGLHAQHCCAVEGNTAKRTEKHGIVGQYLV